MIAKKSSFKYPFFEFLLICFLIACTFPKPTQALAQNPSHSVKQRANLSSWEIRGALAAKNKSKGWTASMYWAQQGPGSYQIRLMGPLGSGTVLINKQRNVITFQDGRKKITSRNAEELLLKQTGVRLPVNNLYYWVRGIPAPTSIQSQQWYDTNYLKQLKQSGYTIDFIQYTSIKGMELPNRIRLEGNGIMIKVVIKSWRVNA